MNIDCDTVKLTGLIEELEEIIRNISQETYLNREGINYIISRIIYIKEHLEYITDIFYALSW